MIRTLRLLAAGALACAAVPSLAQTSAPSRSAVEWPSMARAKVAVPLPPTGPMAADLASRPAPPKWADVPLPPPPAALKAGATAAPASSALPPPPPPPSLDGELVASPAGSGAATAGAAEPAKTPAAQEFVAAPPGDGALAGAAALAATPAASEYSAPGGPNEPKVKMAADQTGAMIQVTQDLDSDRIRMEWAKTGGTLPAFEGNLGMILLYKDLSKEAGEGAYMNGVGLSAGLKLAILNLDPPKYATRDTGFTAWRLGMGFEVGATNVTINIPQTCFTIAGRRTCTGGPQTASMSSRTLSFNLGFMQGFGTFDSPSEWSGMAVGIDWAPSSQKTVMTDQNGNSTESSSFNPRGFALNFESGSLQSMASKMGKKAKIKLSIFFLPPAGDLPLLVTTSIGAVWY